VDVKIIIGNARVLDPAPRSSLWFESRIARSQTGPGCPAVDVANPVSAG
jgi:hypothetical protein